MKKDHPSYQTVLFEDSSNGHVFLSGSTVQTKETKEYNGTTYPLVRLPITSASHPFFTGSDELVDAEGRLEKFRNRYKAAQERSEKIADLAAEQKAQVKANKTGAKKK